jgi:uncharacterized membrane protein YoaK (UPF0700 family)
MTASYPTPQFRRTALAPSVLAALVLLAGIAIIESDGFTVIRFAVSILALVVGVFAWQAKKWWWLIALVPIALVWNPVVPASFEGDAWLAMQYVAALVFVAAGMLIRIRNPEDRNRR